MLRTSNLPALLGTALAATFVLGFAPPASQAGGGTLVFEDIEGQATRLAAGQVSVGDLERLAAVLVRFEGFTPPERSGLVSTDLAHLRLTSGDLVRGRIVAGDGDQLITELIGGSLLAVEIDRLTSILFPGRLLADAGAGLQPAEGEDRLYWKRPGGLDRVDGTIEFLSNDGVTFESVLGSKTFPWGEIAGLFVAAFEQPTEPAEREPGTRVTLDLVDGSRLRGRLVSLDRFGCSLEFEGGRGTTLPLACLSEVTIDDGRLAFLSDLAPKHVEEGSPFGDDLGMRWPHRMDLAVGGGPLIVGGTRYARGIGVHAPSRLTWELGGTWTELRGAVAIDDSVLLLPHQGTVEFRVLLDGELAWTSGTVRGGQPARPIPPLPLAGKRELTLEVLMATEFHIADRADWLRLMLVRE